MGSTDLPAGFDCDGLAVLRMNEYSLRGWRREAAWTAHASAAWSYLIVPITLVLVPITVSRLWVSGMDAMCES